MLLIDGLEEGQSVVVGEAEAGGSVGTPQLAVHIDLSLQQASPGPQKFWLDRQYSLFEQGSPAHGAQVGWFVGNGVDGDSVGLRSGDKVGEFTGETVGCGFVGETVGCGSVGPLVGTGLLVGDSVPSNGIGVGDIVGFVVIGTCTPFLQSA